MKGHRDTRLLVVLGCVVACFFSPDLLLVLPVTIALIVAGLL